jgi:ribulose-5-phosphate 4-epimerase/fuculose-1-phosphate aldolase
MATSLPVQSPLHIRSSMVSQVVQDGPVMPETSALLAKLITAFHILHRKGVLDEYGQVSVRNPLDKSTFFTSSKPANLISSMRDLDQWNVADGSPIEQPEAGIQPNSKVSPFSEHWIHSSILACYPDVNSVVHSHSATMVAAGLLKVNNSHESIQPVFHMAGFVGGSVPIFDISRVYETMPDHTQNMLINNKKIGDALAASLSGNTRSMEFEFADSDDAQSTTKTLPDLPQLPDVPIILQRGHGFVTWATSLEDAVYKAVYAQKNTEIQMMAQNYLARGSVPASELVCLSRREAKDSANTINAGMPRAWPSWAADVKRCGLYVNKLAAFL